MHYETKSIFFLLLENCLKNIILFGTGVHVSVETKLCLSVVAKLQGIILCQYVSVIHVLQLWWIIILCMFLSVKIFLSNAER